MIHDGQRIGCAKPYAGLCQLIRLRGPWLMDQPVGELHQFRHPFPHIGTLGIELRALQHRIEHAEKRRGIGAAAGDPLPVGRIAAGIGIDKRVPEPLFALASRSRDA